MIFLIGDLHLGFSVEKPMEIFGEQWHNHHLDIEKSFRELVSDEDLVIILGDISWGISLEEAMADLMWLDNLPGKKLLLKGNHDYWWTSVKKMKEKFPNIEFLYNSYYYHDGFVISGTRGWSMLEKGDAGKNEKIMKREALRLENSILLGKVHCSSPEKMIVCMHYPPLLPDGMETVFSSIIEKHDVKNCFYGHLHGENGFKSAVNKNIRGVNYRLVSADFLNFNLYKFEE